MHCSVGLTPDLQDVCPRPSRTSVRVFSTIPTASQSGPGLAPCSANCRTYLISSSARPATAARLLRVVRRKGSPFQEASSFQRRGPHDAIIGRNRPRPLVGLWDVVGDSLAGRAALTSAKDEIPRPGRPLTNARIVAPPTGAAQLFDTSARSPRFTARTSSFHSAAESVTTLGLSPIRTVPFS